METPSKVLVIGAGLAGSDAAWFLASNGVPVVLAEVKRLKLGPAQKMTTDAELVCTNSLKSLQPDSSHGMLKHEMKGLGSLILKVGQETAVPAGDALAVDREVFSKRVTEVLADHPLITKIDADVDDPQKFMAEHGCDYCLIASGPLTTKALETWIREKLTGEDDFYFYDAIAPVVDADSLDLTKLYFKDRHKPVGEDGEEADYLNAPMNKEQYDAFIEALRGAERVPAKDFEELKYFESCLPIDTMADRGVDTPRFSCMKPIGLELPDGSLPWACVQLRKENLLGSAYNLVGFQTRLTYPEQKRVFKMIPGFEEAQFIHLGSVHRNSFLNARRVLNFDLSSKKFPNIHFAGQITGVEGYTESASMGLYVGSQILRKIKGQEALQWPVETAIGALINYVMTCEKPVPSNINFGLLPPVTLTKEQRRNKKRKSIKKSLAAERAREVFDSFINEVKA